MRYLARYFLLFVKVILFGDPRKDSVIDAENNRWWDVDDEHNTRRWRWKGEK